MPVGCSALVMREKSFCRRDVPELRLSPSDSINPYVLGVPQRQADWSTSHVTAITVHIVPFLPVAKEERFAVALQGKIFTTESKCCTSLSIRHTNTIAYP
jgi:hypothetical protein